jgi:hypothetical protein
VEEQEQAALVGALCEGDAGGGAGQEDELQPWEGSIPAPLPLSLLVFQFVYCQFR